MAPAPPVVPVLWRIAVGLAILGIGTSLAFMAMPGTTTAVRVVSGVACAACLVFVAVVWRQIGMNQKTDVTMARWRAVEALRRLESETKNLSLTPMYNKMINNVKSVEEAQRVRENIAVVIRNNDGNKRDRVV